MSETAILRPALPRLMGVIARGMETFFKQTDAQLVALALQGNRDAYGELVRRHQSRAYNIARRIVGDPQDALDVTQDAFVRAYDALASFDRARPFAPWFYTIVTNLALNFAQRRHHVEALEPEIERQDESATPEQRVLVAEEQEQVREALRRLPPFQRAVIELRHFQGLSYDEISAALDIPVSDVKSHLFRARQKLKVLFEKFE